MPDRNKSGCLPKPLLRGSRFAFANSGEKSLRGSCCSAPIAAAGRNRSFPVTYYAVRGGLSDGD